MYSLVSKNVKSCLQKCTVLFVKAFVEEWDPYETDFQLTSKSRGTIFHRGTKTEDTTDTTKKIHFYAKQPVYAT